MIRRLAAGLVMASVAAVAAAQEPITRVAPDNMRWVAPDLAGYTDELLFGDVWRRTDLSSRDRSLVTLSALIAGGKTAQLTGHLNRALDNGVTPMEIGGMITHLAFCTGWANAVSAIDVARPVLEKRGITPAAMTSSQGAERLRIARKGSGPISQGSAERFTGQVQVSAPIKGSGGSRIGGATVSFRARARTAWHRHALGQTLIVTHGCGLVQREDGPVERICAGDVAVIAPQAKHWHGATATTAMTHVALSESDVVEWLEQVSDTDYRRGPR